MSDTDPRKVRISPVVMAEMATRDNDGNRLHVDWGEPDADGFYDPVISVDYTDTLQPAAPAEGLAPHPGEHHDYRMTCTRCGEPGYLFVGFHSPGEGFTWTERAALKEPTDD